MARWAEPGDAEAPGRALVAVVPAPIDSGELVERAEDEDPDVAAVAIVAASRRGSLADDDPRLAALAKSSETSVRTRVLAYARDAPELHRDRLESLSTDELGYIRAAARAALTGVRQREG